MAKNKKEHKGNGQQNRNKLLVFLALIRDARQRKDLVDTINEELLNTYFYGYTETVTKVMYLLHDKYGWGHKRLIFLLHLMEDFQNAYVHDDSVTLEDMRQVLADECKIVINPHTFEVDGENNLPPGTAVSLVMNSTKRTI